MTTLTTSPRCDFAAATNRRDTPRIRARFCATISANGNEINGRGTVMDLSIIGCQIEIERSWPIKDSSLMEVRIQVPDLGWSIIIDEAVVQWIHGTRMGLCFVNVRVTEADRLAWVMRREVRKT